MDISRRQIFRLLFAAPAALLLGAAGQPAPARRHILTKAETEALDRIDAYLNGLGTLKGDFLQVGPDGRIDRGTIFLKRPGKVRFEYEPSNPVLVVANDGTVAVANRRLKTVDRYPLWQTPFDFLLADKIDLRRSSAVMGAKIEPGTVTVLARTNSGLRRPNLRFVFADPGIELRQWSVTDAQGLTTTVALSGLTAGAALSDDLFVLPKAPKKAPAAPATPRN